MAAEGIGDESLPCSRLITTRFHPSRTRRRPWYTCHRQPQRYHPCHLHQFTTSAPNSRLVHLSRDDNWLRSYYRTIEPNLHLLRVGDYRASSHAASCYHGYTAAADILLNRLEMADNQYLVIDFSAGVDPLASPIFLKVDVLASVIEPTLKAAAVARQWAEAIQGYPLRLHLIGNKVRGEDDFHWLTVNWPKGCQASRWTSC
jgi:CO dehydrogenase maturation factor